MCGEGELVVTILCRLRRGRSAVAEPPRGDPGGVTEGLPRAAAPAPSVPALLLPNRVPHDALEVVIRFDRRASRGTLGNYR